MSRALALALTAALLAGCAMSHGMSEDADAGIDGGVIVADGGAASLEDGAVGADASTGRPRGGPDGVTCGPNRCRTLEVCCDDRCGICAFEDECPSFECPDPAGP